MGIRVTWAVLSASEVGTSHVAVDKPCEDSCWAQVEEDRDGSPFLSMFVCDGAGSAARGGEGAELAIKTAAEFVATKLSMREFGLTDALAADLVVAVRDRIYAQAEKEGLTSRDFACTFLGVLSGVRGTLVMQIGDGAVVLDTGNGLELAIVPMGGQYANMTQFLTDEDAVKQLVTRMYPGEVQACAAFSDGLQRLALNMATNTPHVPFFEPFWGVLAKATPENEDQLTASLIRFLSSQAVNNRTDDDKTLVLALRR